MKKPRHLSNEERDLWDKVARTADPISKPSIAAKPKPEVLAKKDIPVDPRIPVAFRVGQKVDHSADHDLLPSIREQISGSALAMDKKAFGKMRRGKFQPEARLDLHGMTLERAHPALIGFILSSHSAGRRLVLVITGKGKHREGSGPIPNRLGVLRHQVPQWLRLAPLAPLVLQVSEAHVKHGGHGAYYVYLRRSR